MSSIIGKFTKVGIENSREASNDMGFYIIPHSFGVSRDASTFDDELTEPNSGLWYKSLITSRVNVDYNTVKINCVIPKDAVANSDEIREVYVFAKNSQGEDFVLSFGQPSDVIKYSPEGTVTLELQHSLVDVDLTSQYVFLDTRATELAEHLIATNPHPEFAEALAKAGIFVPTGAVYPDMVGQSFLERVEFSGLNAFGSLEGITFNAKYNGDELNGSYLMFDGSKTVDEVVSEFNNSNPTNPVIHDGTGSEIITGSVTLENGEYHVEQKDIVYRRADGIYAQALADGSEKSKVAGMAYLGERLVRGLGGYVTFNTGFDEHTTLYLSDVDAGKITNISTEVQIGTQMGSDFILFASYGGGSSGSGSAGYDAIVSDSRGYLRVETLQEAIDAIPAHGFILVEKMEALKSRVRTNGKTVNIVFRGHNTGLERYLGQNEIQRITFSAVPTSGSWRLEFVDMVTGKRQFSNDLAFNASASLVQVEINGLTGHNGCTVTGDYVEGFTFTFNDYISLPKIGFTDAGQNEIQRFNFSEVPTDGTIDFEFEGESGENHAFNDTSAQLFAILLGLPNISDIEVRGGIEQRYYEIEFQGVDGLENQSAIVAVNSNLNVGGSGGTGGTEIKINGSYSSEGPIQAVTVKEGRYPSSNLKTGTTKIEMETLEIQKGSEVGPSKAIELDSDNNQIIGLGRLVDFNTGIDMSSYIKTRIEMNFDNVELPIDGKGQIIGRTFNFDGSLGISRDAFDAKPIYDEPVGTKDGVNSVFTLTKGKPSSSTQFALIRNQLWLDDSWYKIEEDVITITKSGEAPVASQSLKAWYTPDILDFTPDIIYKDSFYETVQYLDDEYKVQLSNEYNRGSDRLEFYRNGVLSVLGTVLGKEVDKYQEFSDDSVGLSRHTRVDDLFTAFFKDIRVLSKGELTERLDSRTLLVPAYTVGNNELLLFKNGILMNCSDKGSDVGQQYIEYDSNTIKLRKDSKVTDVFTFIVQEFEGTREDVDGLDNTKIVGLNSSIEKGTTLVFRNGVLIQNTPAGNAVDRYSVVHNLELELGKEAQLGNFITVINYI